ncbi:hypothetical protein NQ176_g655 [Zarea fungicola]|uniref:Uncharacterized protein n=1 Tax=Zarea fungicola TaxID=93591 RepID=A0ACC1NY51_9HYPO|nr:hypothetical protein NQ176_g655 [Lecanicillium fungicola]
MNSPIHGHSVPALTDHALERAGQLTPDVEFRDEAKHNARFACRNHHKGLSRTTINKQRSLIKDPKYWEKEANLYSNVLANVIYGNLVTKCTNDKGTTDWQAVGIHFIRRLTRHGLKTSEIDDKRSTIEDAEYWELEEKRFKEFSKMEEKALDARLQANRRPRTMTPETTESDQTSQPPPHRRRARAGRRGSTKRRQR